MGLLQFERRVFVRLHWGILGCMVALTLLGIAAIAGSESPAEHHATRQALWLLVSVVAFILTVAVNPRWIRALTPVLYVAVLGLLVGLLVTGHTVKGAASWYSLGPLRFQPSEFMKILVVLILADIAARRPVFFRTLPGLAVPLLIAGAPIAIIFLQPDFGTAAVFFPVLFVMLWLGGIRMRHLLILGLLAAVGAAGLATQLKPYQRQRIVTFFHPSEDIQGSDWNIYQARITLGSGLLWGRALSGEDEEPREEADAGRLLPQFDTRTKLDFLPEPHTDFIFASLGEQFGFIGCATVIGLYALMSLFCLLVALQSRSFQGALTVLGLLSIILTHVTLNLGMCLMLLPVTGLPLPFLSYGGSSLLTNFLIGGLICNVAARKREFDARRV